MLSWDEVMALLVERGYEGKKTDFAVLRGILSCLGSPQEKLRFVHVAGTNGKGSASRMLQEILTRSGCRTGLFISPHLACMNERWTVDGEMISDAQLRETAGRVRWAAAQYNAERCRAAERRAEPARPVSFALLTMMAFDYFARKDCDIVVLEVGIGGRLDSTNVIPVPELALIMNLGLEHTEILGSTIEDIAFEKGGIIKPGGRVVLYHQTEAAEAVIRRLSRACGARLVITEPAALRISRDGHTDAESARHASSPRVYSSPSVYSSPCAYSSPYAYSSPWVYSYHAHTDLHLNLPGLYQRRNMLAVLDGVDVLRGAGWNIPETAVRDALAAVTWPGRFEILSRKPLVILDGAHNPNGVEALIRNLTDPYGPLADGAAGNDPDSSATAAPVLFVFGVMADKDIREMLRLLAPYAAGFIMETVKDARAAAAETLSAEARSLYGGPVWAVSSIRAALDLAMRTAEPDTPVVCCGSLYQIAEIRGYFLPPEQ